MANLRKTISRMRETRDQLTKNIRVLGKEFELFPFNQKDLKKSINKGFALSLELYKLSFTLEKDRRKMLGEDPSKVFEDVFESLKDDIENVIDDVGIKTNNKIALLRKVLKEKF